MIPFAILNLVALLISQFTLLWVMARNSDRTLEEKLLAVFIINIGVVSIILGNMIYYALYIFPIVKATELGR